MPSPPFGSPVKYSFIYFVFQSNVVRYNDNKLIHIAIRGGVEKGDKQENNLPVGCLLLV